MRRIGLSKALTTAQFTSYYFGRGWFFANELTRLLASASADQGGVDWEADESGAQGGVDWEADGSGADAEHGLGEVYMGDGVDFEPAGAYDDQAGHRCEAGEVVVGDGAVSQPADAERGQREQSAESGDHHGMFIWFKGVVTRARCRKYIMNLGLTHVSRCETQRRYLRRIYVRALCKSGFSLSYL